MTVICINDEWDYPEGNITPKRGKVYEVVKVRTGTSGRDYYILEGFSSNEGWAIGAFVPIHIPNERITKDIEAPKASSGPVREEAPANC